MKEIELIPGDTFYFKGHGLSDAGTDDRMVAVFPPRPNTIYGALRAAYIHQHRTFASFYAESDETLKKWMGTPDRTGAFSIHGVFLKQKGQLQLPLPLDYQVVKQHDDFIAHPLKLKKRDFTSSATSHYWLQAPVRKKSESAAGKWVSLENWKKANRSKEPIQSIRSMSDYVESYPKLGIQIDSFYGKAKESYLYRLQMMQLKDETAMTVYTSCAPTFQEVSFARIGGENRPWRVIEKEVGSFSFWNEEEKKEIQNAIATKQMARVILLTPAIFNETFSQETLTLDETLEVDVLTRVIGRQEIFGGWDIAKNRPKVRQSLIPAGSVFYIKVEEEQIERLLELAGGFHIPSEKTNEGFGYAVITGYFEEAE